MKTFLRTSILRTSILATVLICACSTVPRTTGLLEQVRTDYAVLQNNPQAERYAPVQMQQANNAMIRANLASIHRESTDDIDHLASIAKDKIALTQEVTARKVAEAEVTRISDERDLLLKNQQNIRIEADQLKVNSVQSQLMAQAALEQAQKLQRATKEVQSRTAQLEEKLADLAAKKTDRGIVVTLGDVLFGFDKSDLNSHAMSAVRKLANVLQQFPERRVLIEGYTDSTGAPAYNRTLSERRADAVRRALQNNGVAGDRIKIRGYGADFPVAPNDTSEHRHMNRRVEIIFSDEDGRIQER